MADRNIIKISISPDAKKAVARVAKEHDMKEMGVASRVYKWFGEQDDVTQKFVMGMLPKGYEFDVLKAAVEKPQFRRPQK